MRKILFSLIFIGCFAGQVAAQFQTGMSINPFSNRLPEIHNPALTPLHSVPSLSLIGASSMTGFDHHPLTASLLCSGSLVDKLGGIVRVNYDQAGLSARTDIQLGLVYYVFLNKSKEAGGDKKGDKFSFSLAGHFIQDKLSRDDILVKDPNDPNLINISQVSPNGDASAGIAFLRENKYYAGLSVYQLLGTKSTYMNTTWENVRKRHYYLQAAYTINCGGKSEVDIELHGIAAAIEFTDYRYETGISVSFLKSLTMGIGYQSNGAIKIHAGIKAQAWDFGYACSYGERVEATKYTYKVFQNGIFIRKLFNEGRRSKS